MALCGSHIANDARLTSLGHMVGSWYTQHYAVPLRISLSCDDSIKEKVHDRVDSLQRVYSGLTVELSDEPLSQGQHYQRLVRRLQAEGWDGRGTWVLLTDDDDIWHPRRTLTYATTLWQLRSGHSNYTLGEVLSLCSSQYIDAVQDHSVTSAFRVDTLLQAGSAPLTNLLQHGVQRAESGEAWCHSMRLCTLAQYFAKIDSCIVSHPFWDLCLVKFLRFQTTYRTCFLTGLPEDNWMYYYRRDEAVGPTSRLLAKSSLPLNADLATSLESNVRHNLELYCAMHTNSDACAFAFAEFNVKNVLDPELREMARAVSRKVAQQLLSDTNSIHCKLLHSPIFLQSDHA